MMRKYGSKKQILVNLQQPSSDDEPKFKPIRANSKNKKPKTGLMGQTSNSTRLPNNFDNYQNPNDNYYPNDYKKLGKLAEMDYHTRQP